MSENGTPELSRELRERGFEHAQSDALSGWATDGEVTVQVQAHLGQTGLGPHEVVVYEGTPEAVDVTNAIGHARERSHDVAIRRALDAAGVERPPEAR